MIHLLGIKDIKSIRDIMPTFFSGLQRLFGGIPNPYHMACIYRDTGIFAYSPGNELRLVVSSLAEARRMEGHRNDHIDRIKKIRILHLHGSLVTEETTYLGLVRIFEFMHDLPDRVIFLIKEIRHRPLQVHRLPRSRPILGISPKRHLRTVINDLDLLRTRQTSQTTATKRIPVLSYMASARAAYPRKEETRE